MGPLLRVVVVVAWLQRGLWGRFFASSGKLEACGCVVPPPAARVVPRIQGARAGLCGRVGAGVQRRQDWIPPYAMMVCSRPGRPLSGPPGLGFSLGAVYFSARDTIRKE